MTEQEIVNLLGSLHEKIQSLIVSADRPLKRYLTVANAAVYCDLSEESIRRLVSTRKLTAHRPVRGRVLIDRHELDSLIRCSVANQKGGRGQAHRP